VKVKCVSPHGGLRLGTDGRGQPVEREDYAGPRQLPPNDGGYIDNAVLGRVPVGAVADAPDDFIVDGFHFELAADPPKAPPAAPAPVVITADGPRKAGA
jgi:hypothetical protein